MFVRLAVIAAIIRFLWNSTRGNRLRPWASPYLRWRVETYWGLPAAQIDGGQFRRFIWRQRRELVRFLLWAGEMGSRSSRREPPARPARERALG